MLMRLEYCDDAISDLYGQFLENEGNFSINNKYVDNKIIHRFGERTLKMFCVNQSQLAPNISKLNLNFRA